MQKPALLMERNAFPLAFEIHRGEKLLNASRASRVLRMDADSVGERELHLLIANQQSRQLRRGVSRDVRFHFATIDTMKLFYKSWLYTIGMY